MCITEYLFVDVFFDDSMSIRLLKHYYHIPKAFGHVYNIGDEYLKE